MRALVIARLLVIQLALLLTPPATLAADAVVPLQVRNTAPAALLFGVPTLVGDRAGPRLTLDHGNMFSATTGDGLEAVFDGETTVVALAWHYTAANGWSAGAEVPWVRHSGGFLDGFIEGYHDLFGFPGGGRELAPRDRLLYRITGNGTTHLDIDDSASGLGDVRLHAGRALFADPARRLSVRGLVKLPTGEAQRLTGSGAVDAGLWLEYTQSGVLGAERLSLSAMAGGMVLGKGDLLPGHQREFLAMGHLGFGYRLTDRIELLMQAEAQGAAFDLDSPILGRQTLLGTLGGRVRLRDRLWLDLGVVEDLYSDSAPDVIFHLSLGNRPAAK